jgi:hypothetical protein|tara:strand:+ start:810 stop:989 length:180 start_codon:yes stop_codon:yes gene_type:complete
MNRKFIHYVLIKVTDLALKAFIVSLGTLAFGGIAFIIFMMITGQVDYGAMDSIPCGICD